MKRSIVAAMIPALATGAVRQPTVDNRYRHSHRHHRHHRHHRRHHHRHNRSRALASWYYDGGSTASGYHAYYGVANRTLPFGTRVKICYPWRSRRCVRATVDDRGPYVYPREWDLNQNTARALGFSGVATVGTTVL